MVKKKYSPEKIREEYLEEFNKSFKENEMQNKPSDKL